MRGLCAIKPKTLGGMAALFAYLGPMFRRDMLDGDPNFDGGRFCATLEAAVASLAKRAAPPLRKAA